MEYGRLTVLENSRDKDGKVLCMCSCGVKKRIKLCNVKSGSTKSCGCLLKEHLRSVHKKQKRERSTFDKYVGKTFGRLTVVDGKRLENDKVICKCSCGAQRPFNAYNVIKGGTKSCGCLKKDLMKVEAKKRFKGVRSKNFKDYTGVKIGVVEVLKKVEDTAENTTRYLLRCECGTEFMSGTSRVLRLKYNTCGCGYKKHRLKGILKGMKNRCNNPNEPRYKWYGKKGVKVCEEWAKYPIKFIEWSYLNGYKDQENVNHSETLSIDRIDSNGDYCPENCHWITVAENSHKSASERWRRFNESDRDND